MSDSLHPVETHSLPSLLAQSRALAHGEANDTRCLTREPRLFDLDELDCVLVEGRDRIRFLHAMLSNDIAGLSPGEGRWATLNSVQGKTVCDVRLFVLDDHKKTGAALALLEPGAGKLFTEALDRYIIADKCYFSDDAEHSMILLSGVGMEEALKQSGATLPEDSLFAHCATQLGGTEVRLFRVDRTGPGATDIAVRFAKEDASTVRQALSAFKDGSPELLETARIEGGMPRFGIDFTPENIPLEAGLKEWAISFTKGCYVGQEVICRIDSMGSPKRRLVRLASSAGSAPTPGTLLFAGGKNVGWTTSAAQTPDGWTAFGYVKKRSNEPGTPLQLGSLDGAEVLVGDPIGNV